MNLALLFFSALYSILLPQLPRAQPDKKHTNGWEIWKLPTKNKKIFIQGYWLIDNDKTVKRIKYMPTELSHFRLQLQLCLPGQTFNSFRNPKKSWKYRNWGFIILRPRTHGVKKVPESQKFESNLAQNPLFWFKFVGSGHVFDSMCTNPNTLFTHQNEREGKRSGRRRVASLTPF